MKATLRATLPISAALLAGCMVPEPPPDPAGAAPDDELSMDVRPIRAPAAAVADRLAQEAYVKATNTGGADRFHRVALSADGSTLAVGAYLEDSAATGIDGDQTNNSARQSGAVYVYTRSGARWVPQAYLKASNTDADDQFGYQLALSADGSTLAVGAMGEDSRSPGIDGDQADDSLPDAGAVYVFTRSGETWRQQAYVKASYPTKSLFGANVALSADGRTLAVGAHLESSGATGIDGDQTDGSAFGSGAVYVFVRSGETWRQQAYVKASNTDVWDLFGISLALSGDGSTLAVGANGEDGGGRSGDGDQADDSTQAAGAVYVFTRSDTTWSQQAYLKASNPGAYDQFGAVVSLSASGSVLAVGAPWEDSSATGVNGDPLDDRATDSGAVYVLTRSGTGWSQQAYLKASNTDAVDGFGCALMLSLAGSTLAVGAAGESSAAMGIGGDEANNAAPAAGAAYLFTRSRMKWDQQAYIKASNTARGDLFGGSVALSGNGLTLAVGAVGEDSSATGVNGDQTDNRAAASGAVYVFR